MPTTRILFFLAGAALLAMPARGEELDLTKVRTFDWSKEEAGGIKARQALLSPTLDAKELAGLMRRGNGVRLSSEDPEHAVVVALGQVPAGTVYALTQTHIDRFRHIVELTFEITKPAPGQTDAKAALEVKKAPQDDLVIAPVNAPPARALPPSVDGVAAGNTAFVVPAGRLEFGTWYLRVRTFIKEADKRTEAPAITDTFAVKDDRPILKGEKGKKTPSAGLEVPNSRSVTEGMGAR
ncbi:MAG: hypothetical protein KIS92_02510 [Planctomycetota bacterium]|nr:hypothetical protein [Planctomycetota bacterium]